MSNAADRVEIITSVQRRRRWTAAEKVRMVEETFEPGMTVSLVARRHGVAPNQLFTWRRLVVEGALTAARSGEQVVPASDYRALQSQVRELQRLIGKKTLVAEILKEALEHVTGSKKQMRLPPSPPNHKRVYRVMKVHDLLLDRHAGGTERRHDGRIAVDERNRRWCSDGFEIGCDNGERVRVAFALDCCDREAMSFLATTSGVSGEDVRDLMVAAVEYRFGQVNRLPVTIEWLSDNGSCYVAGDTRSFARDIGLEPRTTPFESPKSNGMAEA